MGIQGTEVAKESSDIIILDDNFASVVKVSLLFIHLRMYYMVVFFWCLSLVQFHMLNLEVIKYISLAMISLAFILC